MSESSFYKVLGVSATCSADEVRRAYHQAARKYHPDKKLNDLNAINSAGSVYKEFFLQVQEAYETLHDSVLRQQYDTKLHNELMRKRICEKVVVSDEMLYSDMQRAALHGENGDENEVMYSHRCRCGEFYEITESELHDGVDVVACTGCSLHIRVLYGRSQ
ncbi:putative DnaJ domain, Zinc finger, DPH-type, DPH Zinc finger superfamily [Plasmopara halstedii]